jgi:hypothetical protein
VSRPRGNILTIRWLSETASKEDAECSGMHRDEYS